VAVGVGLALALPAIAAAHPLGNFTINHYAGLRIAANRVDVDLVIDMAEIPTFQETTRIDTSGDGKLSDAEIEAERVAVCPRLAKSVSLTVGGVAQTLTTVEAGLSFPVGAAGAPTMRIVCEYRADLAMPIGATTDISFSDTNWSDRIGWREVVVQGDGTTLTSDLPTATVSDRLRTYPTTLLSSAPAVRTAAFGARAGGAALAPWTAPDAGPLTGGPAPASASTSAADPAAGAVPGGVAGDVAGLLGARDLTPLVVFLSFLTAILLGAGHALTPGHGKTIMAAYLVGTRGRARHAVGLGLATAVSHTIGVLVLALLIVAAGSALPADRVYPVLTALSGVIVIAIGAWLLAGQAMRWLRPSMRPAPQLAVAMAGDAHDHPHDHHDHAEEFGGRYAAHVHDDSAADDHVHTAVAVAVPASNDGLHRHGWRVHSHVPGGKEPPTLTWRSLFALGLSGGLVPSTNALLILVTTVAAGRAGYGLVLVVAFGIGMATVLVGVGLALVYASGFANRASPSPTFTRLLAFAPTVAAIAVLGLGIYLTAGAIGGNPVL
jgi:ABC-type nickel/cobalt efflux system permease component RcnA